MSKIIGSANEFYRLRVLRMDETEEPDLEWRDDILYRDPPPEIPVESECWGLEAVSIDDENDVTRIACYETSEAAHEALDSITEELGELTKSEFETRYLTGGESL